MRKRYFSIILSLCLLFSMTACGDLGSSDIFDDDSAQKESSQTDDPFGEIETAGNFSGAISHGAADPNLDQNQMKLPFEYNGGEISVEYFFRSEGDLVGIGFLLFLDGIPQAYKISSSEAEYEYCHTFPAEGQKEVNFEFIFTPCTGSAGDTLNLTVLSITNPDFQPDMIQSSGYGWYHKMLPYESKIHFNVDADSAEYPVTKELFLSASLSDEKVTASFLENELSQYGWGNVSLDTLNDGMFYTISYDGSFIYNHINVDNKETVSVRFTVCGVAGEDFRISFWGNHQPISNDGILAWQASVKKGNLITIEAVIDISSMDDFTTFYAIAVPIGNSTSAAYKTESILLYKGD